MTRPRRRRKPCTETVCAVYDGATRLGEICQNAEKVTAFDADGKVIGMFATMRDAAKAVIGHARAPSEGRAKILTGADTVLRRVSSA